MEFDISVGSNGDCYDATWCASRRCASRTASCGSASTGLRENPAGDVDDHKIATPTAPRDKESMEQLIHHFKLVTEGMHVPEGESTLRWRPLKASSASTWCPTARTSPTAESPAPSFPTRRA